jgi:hypothetical protein
MWKLSPLVFFTSLFVTAVALTLGCGNSVCDCYDGSPGLMITTDAPVTSVTLSGAACMKGQFRCVPENLDNKIHGDCKSIQVVAKAEGTCVVDLTIGGVEISLERQMRRSTCECYGTYYTEANQAGEIDLRQKPDGSVPEQPRRVDLNSEQPAYGFATPGTTLAPHDRRRTCR